MTYENLYDSLGYNICGTDLTSEEKDEILDIISQLDVEKREVIYLLMLHDWIKSNPNTKVIFPYKSKQISPDKLEIKIDALPIKLKRIIYKFCKLAQIKDGEQIKY